MHHRSGEHRIFLRLGKSCLFLLLVGSIGSIFLGPFHQIRDIAYGYAQRHANVCADGRTSSVICTCLSTNIEIFSFIFNITGANATRTIQIREMRRFHSRRFASSFLGDSMRRGQNRRMNRGMNSPRTARRIQDSIRIEYKQEICLH